MSKSRTEGPNGVHPKQRNIDFSLEGFENTAGSGLPKAISVRSSMKECNWTKYAFKNQASFKSSFKTMNISII